jgi:hypothetical protein
MAAKTLPLLQTERNTLEEDALNELEVELGFYNGVSIRPLAVGRLAPLL